MTRGHPSGQHLVTLRRQVIARHGPYCGRCGAWIDVALSGLHPDGLTVGHVIPVSAGGTSDPVNLRPEHRRCNLAAGARRDPPRALIAAPVPAID